MGKERQLVEIENKYLKNKLRNILNNNVKKFIVDVLKEIIKNDQQLAIQYVSMLLNSVGAPYPSIWLIALVKDAPEKYLDYIFKVLKADIAEHGNKVKRTSSKNVIYKYFEGTNLNLKQDVLTNLLVQRLSYEQDKQAFLISRFNYLDFEGALKTMKNIAYNEKNETIKQCHDIALLKELFEEKNAKSIGYETGELIQKRNNYVGHDNDARFLDKTKIIDIKDSTICFIEYFNTSKFINLKNEKDEIIKLLNEWEEQYNNLPVAFNSIRKDIPNFVCEDLNESRYEELTDKAKEIIYLTKKNTIVSYLKRLAIIQDVNTRLLSNENIIEKQLVSNNNNLYHLKQLEKLSKLSIFEKEKSYLNNEQLKELLQNTIVFVSGNVLMDNSKGQDRLKNFLRFNDQFLIKENLSMYVSTQTRLEIFQTELNDKLPQEQRQNAKHLRNILRSLQEHESIKFLKSSKNSVDIYNDIIYHFAKTFPDQRFGLVQLFSDKENIDNFSNMIVESNTKNVLPITYGLKREEGKFVYAFRVQENCEPFFNDFCNGELEKENTLKETKTSDCEHTSVAEQSPIKQTESVDILSTNEKKSKEHEANSHSHIEKAITPVIESHEYIKIDKIPSIKDLVYLSDGTSAELKEKIGEGGEGIIYSTNKENTAIKIYNDSSRTKFKEDKLRKMLQLTNTKNFCWINSLVFNDQDNKEFVGYAMRLIDSTKYKPLSQSVLRLSSESLYKNVYLDWTRESLVRVCVKICQSVAFAHENNIIIGDLNKNNIMVNIERFKDPVLYFVDCDSLQYEGYPCTVYNRLFVDPKIYEEQCTDDPDFSKFLRTEENDLYALAVMLFNILMLDTPPYGGAGVSDANLLEAIKNHNFQFRNSVNNSSGKDAPDGPGRMIWNNMDSKVKSLFIRVFAQGEYVYPKEWIRVLNGYITQLKKGKLSNDIYPNKYLDLNPDSGNYKYFKCESCGCDTNLYKDEYERTIKYKGQLLCPKCKSSLLSLRYLPVTPENDKKIPRSYTCAYCGKTEYYANYYDAYMNSRKTGIKYCNEHNKLIKFKCYNCGKEEEMKAGKYLKYSPKARQQLLCNECLTNKLNGDKES